ncbi:Protein of unknown function [Pyronema omphalodes CBS 100304]|uniref:Uncharacterized protein n=1 Tax=Pyronema omphalodes (strain CBS 100304) TaxID=1076935 RepID=U4LE66_PYROM|nr:Protein of unknown function [Pyronema omphalodes CBS 100304]
MHGKGHAEPAGVYISIRSPPRIQGIF